MSPPRGRSPAVTDSPVARSSQRAAWAVHTPCERTCSIPERLRRVVRHDEVGGGLLGLRPIDFTGDIDCSPAGSSNAPVSYSGLALTSDPLGLRDVLPLGLGQLGGAAGQLSSPPNTDEPPTEEGPVACRVDPGYDCGRTGRANGLPATTYQLIFGVGFRAPEGETWTDLPEECQSAEEASFVSCVSLSEPFTTQ